MRLGLVLAVVVALVAVLYFALSAGPDTPSTASAGVAPATRAEPAAAPIESADLAPSVPVTRTVEPSIAAPNSAAALVSARANLTVVVSVPEGTPLVGAFAECRDALARIVPLENSSPEEWHASDLAGGEYTVSVLVNGYLPAFRRVVLEQPLRDQRVEIVLEHVAVVRVRWQVDDGRPILDALESPGILASAVFLRVATDDVLRSPGDRAPGPRQAFVFNVGPNASAKQSVRRAPWPGAPPDAVCELTLASALPAVVCASIDGTILESTRVEDASIEVVFRTPLEFLRTVNSSVRFCLVDDETGEPLVGAEFMATTGGGVGRSPIRVGPTGCREDPRFSPGKWVLRFSASGFAPLFRDVEIAGGNVLDLGELRMNAPASIHVRASDSDGTPVPGVALSLLSVERAAWGDRSIVSTNTDGGADFTDLSRDPYLLVVADARFASRCQVVHPETGTGQRRIEVLVEKGVEVSLDFGPRTATDARAFVSDHEGRVVSIVTVPPAGRAPLRLVPGEYVVELEGAANAAAITVTDESVVYDLR